MYWRQTCMLLAADSRESPLWGPGALPILCSVTVLLTGMVLGKHFWGYSWTWRPGLTLILCGLFGAIALLTPFLHPWSRRATVCAAIAFLDVPLICLSVRLLPDAHPAYIPLTREMRNTLGETGSCCSPW
ncbi:MAG: hypothetical protein IT433_07765 [Phycisphaerales bacterium]|nr:hypothetical protein [Phycisphaerales bacterium]